MSAPSPGNEVRRVEFVVVAIFSSVLGVLCAFAVVTGLLFGAYFVPIKSKVATAFEVGTLSADEYFESGWLHGWRLQRDCEAIYMASAQDIRMARYLFAPRLPKNAPDQDLSMCTMLRDTSTELTDLPYQRTTAPAPAPGLSAVLGLSMAVIPAVALRQVWGIAALLAFAMLLARVWVIVHGQYKRALIVVFAAFGAFSILLTGASLSMAPALCVMALGTAACLRLKSIKLESMVLRGAMSALFGALMMLFDYYSGTAIAGFALLVFCSAASLTQARLAVSQWLVGCYAMGMGGAFLLRSLMSVIARSSSSEAIVDGAYGWLNKHFPMDVNEAQSVFAQAGKSMADVWWMWDGAGGALIVLLLGFFIFVPLWIEGRSRKSKTVDSSLTLVSALIIMLLIWGVFNLRDVGRRPQEYLVLLACGLGAASWVVVRLFHTSTHHGAGVRIDVESEA